MFRELKLGVEPLEYEGGGGGGGGSLVCKAIYKFIGS